MNKELFKYIVENQKKWCEEYNKNKEYNHKINIILGRRYKSRGNHSPEKIQESLEKFYKDIL